MTRCPIGPRTEPNRMGVCQYLSASMKSRSVITYHAAVLRYMPDAFTGEFANVGLLMASVLPTGQVLDWRFAVTDKVDRLAVFFRDLWDPKSWGLWRDAFNVRDKEMKSAFQAGQYSSFQALLDTKYSPGGGAFHWADAYVGAAESLDEAFTYNLRDLVLRHS